MLVSCESLTLKLKRFHCHLMAYVERGDLDFEFSEFLRKVCRKALVLSRTTDMLLSALKDLRIEAKASQNAPEWPALWYLELEDYYETNFGESYENIASRLECLISWLIQDAHILDMGVMSPTKQTRLIRLFVKVNKDMQRPLRRTLPVTSRERHETDQAITTAFETEPPIVGSHNRTDPNTSHLLFEPVIARTIAANETTTQNLTSSSAATATDLVPYRSSCSTTNVFCTMDFEEPYEAHVETKTGPSLFELWNWYLQTGLGAFTVVASLVTALILIVGAKADIGIAFQVASWVLAAGTLVAVTIKLCLNKRPRRRDIRGTP